MYSDTDIVLRNEICIMETSKEIAQHQSLNSLYTSSFINLENVISSAVISINLVEQL